jgi:hypothetical protein
MNGGACDPATEVAFDCEPFGCDPAFGACRARCNTTADCATGATCEANVCIAATNAPSSGGCAIAGGEGPGDNHDAPLYATIGIAMVSALGAARSAKRRRR